METKASWAGYVETMDEAAKLWAINNGRIMQLIGVSKQQQRVGAAIRASRCKPYERFKFNILPVNKLAVLCRWKVFRMFQVCC